MAALPKEITANIANLGKGLTEIPSEIYKYPNLAANRLATFLSGGSFMGQRIQTDIDIQRTANQLKPLNTIAPELVKRLEQEPNAEAMNSIGQTAAGGLLAGTLRGPRTINYLQRLKGTSSAGTSEYAIEPVLDQVAPKVLPRFAAPVLAKGGTHGFK